MNDSSPAPSSITHKGGDLTVPQQTGFWDVVKDIKPAELKWDNIIKVPCSSKALLTGIATGTLIGLTRYTVKRGGLRSAGNWGVLSFAGTSMITWEFCRYQRKVVQQQLDAMANGVSNRGVVSLQDSEQS
ncbi:hypothetical protein DFS34DRAFT_609177 [Phlyctochytrium arcticum]|nr:hypothetical protein DFS34DRAFT_609177 [Phlyctochytrium arcticum]